MALSDKEITLKNLRKVYEELPILAEKDPRIKQGFNMSVIGVFQYQNKEQIQRNECGTVGCLFGHSARVFKLLKCFFNARGAFNYGAFGRIKFPYLYNEDCLPNNHWLFLYDTIWKAYQPTFDQAIERLKYFLDHNGEIPYWDYQTESFIKN